MNARETLDLERMKGVLANARDTLANALARIFRLEAQIRKLGGEPVE